MQAAVLARDRRHVARRAAAISMPRILRFTHGRLHVLGDRSPVGNVNSWHPAQASAAANFGSRDTACGAFNGASMVRADSTLSPPGRWQLTHATPSAASSASGPRGSASGAWQPRQNGSGSLRSALWKSGDVYAARCSDPCHSAAIASWHATHSALRSTALSTRCSGAGPGITTGTPAAAGTLASAHPTSSSIDHPTAALRAKARASRSSDASIAALRIPHDHRIAKRKSPKTNFSINFRHIHAPPPRPGAHPVLAPPDA